jgi:uncharacterized membrane protein
MLNSIKSYFISGAKKTLSSIGFIPTIVASAITFLVIFLILIDSPDRNWLITAIPLLEIEYADTARDLITAFLAGTISLIIFSFTMMMFVLQQAASNYSSKIIGGIISIKSNQIVLGTYVGTVIYMILALIQIREADEFDQVPQLPIFVGLLLFILCIILFVKFINDIFNSVQIYKVIERIYHKTAKKIKKHESNKRHEPVVGEQKWHIYTSEASGYFQDISTDSLIKIAQKNDFIIRINLPKGFYHGIGEPLFSLTKKIEDKDVITSIEESMIFYAGEKISDNYFFGIRQLSEVAVQSLSTGINAPGVAIACLDYLGDIMSITIRSKRTEVFNDDKGIQRIILPNISVSEIFEICITPIRIYGKKDLNILISLLNFLKRISYNDKNLEYQNTVLLHFNSVLEDGKNSLQNRMDKTSLQNTAKKIQMEVPEYFII